MIPIERIKRLTNDTLDFTNFDSWVDYIKGKQTNKTMNLLKRVLTSKESIRPDIVFTVAILKRYQSNPSLNHRATKKL